MSSSGSIMLKSLNTTRRPSLLGVQDMGCNEVLVPDRHCEQPQ